MLIAGLLALALWLYFPRVTIPASSKVTVDRPGRWPRRRAGKGSDPLSEDAHMVRELAALLRSGLTLYPAIELLLEASPPASPVTRYLRTLHAQQPLGAESVQAPPVVTGSPGVQRLAWCLTLCAESGAALAQVLEHLADDLEATLTARRGFEAAMAGTQATARLLTWLPLAGLAVGLLFGIDVFSVLGGSTAAQVSVLLGLALWALNRWWCARLLAATRRKAEQ